MPAPRELLLLWLQDHNYNMRTIVITCDECESRPGCKLAYDSYNINGKCLRD